MIVQVCKYTYKELNWIIILKVYWLMECALHFEHFVQYYKLLMPEITVLYLTFLPHPLVFIITHEIHSI